MISLNTEQLRPVYRSAMDMLANAKSQLKSAGIKCEIKDGKAVIGTHKGEPFCVYVIKSMFISRSGNEEYMCVMVTRYKGKDVAGKRPVDVLNET